MSGAAPRRLASAGVPPGRRPALRHSAAEDRWLRIGPACKALGIDRTTLRRWTAAGWVKAWVTPGGHRRYRVADLDALRAATAPSVGSQ